MAHIHGVSASLNETDKPIHHISETPTAVVWLSPCTGMDVFMPDDAEKAAAYLENLAREVATLRLYYSVKLNPTQQ